MYRFIKVCYCGSQEISCGLGIVLRLHELVGERLGSGRPSTMGAGRRFDISSNKGALLARALLDEAEGTRDGRMFDLQVLDLCTMLVNNSGPLLVVRTITGDWQGWGSSAPTRQFAIQSVGGDAGALTGPVHSLRLSRATALLFSNLDCSWHFGLFHRADGFVHIRDCPQCLSPSSVSVSSSLRGSDGATHCRQIIFP